MKALPVLSTMASRKKTVIGIMMGCMLACMISRSFSAMKRTSCLAFSELAWRAF